MIRFACAQCHKGFQVEDRAAGKKTKCPQCGATLSIPAPGQHVATKPVPPLSAAKNIAASAQTDDRYTPDHKPTSRIQDDSWNARPAPSAEALVPVPIRLDAMPSQVGDRRSTPTKGPSLVYLGTGAVLLIGIAVGAALWATGSLSKMRGDGEPPKTDPQKIAVVRLVPVSGQLFVTTKGGDVKKAAGQKIHLTPITPQSQKSFVAQYAKVDQRLAELNRIYKEGEEKVFLKGVEFGTPEYEIRYQALLREYGPQLDEARGEYHAALDTAMNAILVGSSDAVADSEGKFQLEIPPGRYLLWTAHRQIAEQSFSWLKLVELRDAPLNLILTEDSIFLYPYYLKDLDYPEFSFEEDLFRRIVTKTCLF